MKNFKRMITENHKKDDFKECTDNQLLRKGMIEEIEAINKYEKMANAASDPRVRTLFLDVAKEEKVHMEEFEELLERLDPEMEETDDQAEEEIEDLFGEE